MADTPTEQVVSTNEDIQVTQLNGGGAQLSIKTPQAETADTLIDEVLAEQQAVPPTPPTPSTAPSVDSIQKALNEAETKLNNAGIDFAALEKEYSVNGSLSEGSYKTLTDAGYPKEIVEATLAGWKASTNAFVDGVVQLGGGEKEFARLQDFIKAEGGSLKDFYNAAIDSGNLQQVQMVLENAQNRMVKAYGTSNPTIMGGKGTAVETVKGYQTKEEMINDFNDPRYQKDPAFTKEVYRKVNASPLF